MMKKNRIIQFSKLMLIMCSACMFFGCSLLSPAKPAQTTYVLNSMPAFIPTKKTLNVNLMVTPPETIPAYNTTQMAYTIKPFEISYFSLNSWIDTPAQMLQPLLVQTLQRTHHFHAVILPSSIARTHYLLNTQILKLQQNFRCESINYELKLRVQIIKVATNQVLATKQINIIEPVPEATPYGGVIAANRATARVLEEIAAFSLKVIK